MSESGETAKRFENDLHSLREKYLAILEAQVVVPLRNELTSRRGEASGAPAKKVDSAIALLDDGMTHIRTMKLHELITTFGGR